MPVAIRNILLSFSFIILSIFSGNSQIINLPCQDETNATIGLDRKAWAGIGNTTNHSEGSKHNFTLPANPGDCKEIANVEIIITVINVDLSNLTCSPPGGYYINIAAGCPDFTPASCPTANLIGEPNGPNLNSQTLNYSNPPSDFQFGENLSIDIVPVMDVGCPNGQSAISSGEIILEYNICVNVTIVDVTPASTVDLGSDLIVCQNETTLLDAGTFNDYLWGPNGEITPTIIAGLGTYTVTVTDNIGCTSTDEIMVTEFPDAPITFDPATPSACDGGTVQVSVLESYGMYNWSNSLTGQTVTLSPGTYTVTITDSNLCQYENSITVGNVTSPEAGINNFIMVCNDGTLTNIEAQLGPHDTGGSWNDDDLSGIDININPMAVDFSSLSPGTYDFTYTVTGTAPCPDDDATITVEIVEENFSGISNAGIYCFNPGTVDFFDLLGNPTIGGNFIDVNSSFVNLSDGFSVNLDGLSPNTYEFIYNLDPNGPCDASQTSLFITILDSAEAGDNNSMTVCEGAFVDLTFLLSFDATPGGTFSDDNFTGQLSGTTVSTNGLSGNSYDFTYTAGGSGGQCGGDMAIITITVESSVTSGIDVSQNVCEGEIIDLYGLLMGEDAGGSFSDITGNGGLTTNMLNTSGLPVGISEYQYLVGDGVSCPKDSSLISINVVASPNLDAVSDTIMICADNCETITYNLSGSAPFSFTTSIYSQNGTYLGGQVNNINSNSYTLTACQIANSESYENDTLNVLADSIYTITIPSIIDGNCSNNFNGREDTLYIMALDYARFDLDTTACISDTLDINGYEFFDGNATLVDTISGQRCDSIINITVSFTQGDTILFNPILCSGGSTMIGSIFYDAANPSDTIIVVNPDGCDSVSIINLSFYPESDSLLMVSLCAGVSTDINGTTYNESNLTGSDTLQSINGCDSIVTVQVSITNGIIINRNDILCMNETINIGGQTFDFNNQSDQIILSGTGCDTTINVDLNFVSLGEGDLIGPFCINYSEIINGNVYDFNNPIGTETLGNASSNGCDSIVNINLTFYPNTEGSLEGPFCEDYSQTINGNIYDINNPDGTEILLNASSNGCDSTVNINLVFYPTVNNPVTRNLCIGDSLFVGGAFQFSDGVFMDTLISNNSCDSIITTTLTFTPCLFDVDITSTDNICSGEANGSILVESNSPAGETYSINLTDEDGNTELISNIDGPNIGGTFNSLEPGVYSIIVFDASGTTVYSEDITIISTNPEITGSWSIINSISCEGGSGSIMYTAAGGQPPYMYQWSDISIGDTSTGDNLVTGSYGLTITDDLGCTAITDFLLPDGQNQDAILEIMDPSCETATDGSIQITNLDNQYEPYIITINNVVADSSYIDGLSSGTYDIVITDVNLCIISISETLEADNNIEFGQYTENYIITEGDSINLTGEVTQDNLIYSWMSEDNSLSCIDCPTPTATPTATTQYNLLISDENGCSQLIEINVVVEPKELIIEIANIFSPNGDNVNDNIIFDYGENKILSIRIFDRWGNQVFQDESINGIISWDGYHNGNILTNGVYVYNLQIADLEGNIENKFGDIMLLN